jgi:PKD repeat protein
MMPLNDKLVCLGIVLKLKICVNPTIMKKNKFLLLIKQTMRTINILLLFSCTINAAEGQLIKQWDFSYGGYDSDFINQLLATADGGFIAGGISLSDSGYEKSENNFNSGTFTYDLWIIKCDANGNKLWDKNLGGTDNDFYYRSINTSDGGLLVMGSTNSPLSGNITNSPRGTFDMYLVKLSATGSIQWDKRYGGSGGNSASDGIQLTDGGYLILGSTNSPQGLDVTDPSYGSDDYWLVRLDSIGNKLWDKRYGGSDGEGGARILQHPNGGFILVGISLSNISGVKTDNNYVTGFSDIWTVRIDSSGNIIGDKVLGSLADDYGVDANLTPDQNFIFSCINFANVGGDKTENTYAVDDFWVIKTDTSLVRIWDHSVGGDSNEDDGGKLSINNDGSYLVSGTSYSNPGFWKSVANNGPENTWVIKIDANGNKVWDKTVLTGYSHTETGMAIQLLDGCYLMANDGDSFLGGDKTDVSWSFDYWIVKYCDLSAAPNAAFTAPADICPGSCIDFTNLSQNATTYQWNFQGASVVSSTDINPSGICYNTSGSYDVTLIANGAAGSDTLTLTDYITVYPSPPPQGIQQNGDTLVANQGSFSYQWYYNGTLISGATNYFLIAAANGDYNVVCTDINGCEVEAVIFNVNVSVPETVSDPTGIVQPNPFSRTITCLAAGKIIMHDSFGKKIYSKEWVTRDEGVDFSFLPSGIYFLNIETGGTTVAIKLVKL